MKLCDNPRCKYHCEVVRGADGLRYAGGFATLVAKEEAVHFKESAVQRFCVCCESARKIKASRWSRLWAPIAFLIGK